MSYSKEFGPADVLSRYLTASHHGKIKEAYQYISSEDKAFISIKNFSPNLFALPLSKKISFKIQEVEIIEQGNKAKINIKETMPDLTEMFEDNLSEFNLAFGEEKSDTAMEKMLAKKYKNKKIPMTTEPAIFYMVKEPAGWKVFLNSKIKEKVRPLRIDAEHFEEKGQLVEAIEKYKEILTLGYGNSWASQKIEELEAKNKVIITNIDVNKTYFLNQEETEISGEIKNAGDRTLKVVYITIYFLDEEDKAIGEMTGSPVQEGDFPLKPNYSRKFSIQVPDDYLSSNWAKKVKISVILLRFESDN